MPPNDVAELVLSPSIVNKPLPHDSARLHVQGAAVYVDDLWSPRGRSMSRSAWRTRRADC